MGELLDEAVATVEQLRVLTREAHAALKDAKRARRDLDAAVKAARDAATAAARTAIGEVVEAEVARALAELGEETRTAMDESVAKIQAEFDRIANLFLTGHRDGRGEHILNVAERRYGLPETPRAEGTSGG